MQDEHSQSYGSSQEEILAEAMRTIDAATDAPVEIQNNDAARAYLAASLAAHAKSKAHSEAIARRLADAMKQNGAARLAVERGGLPWEWGGREHCAKQKRRARLPLSRPRNLIEAQAYRSRQRMAKRAEAEAIASLLTDLVMPVPAVDEVELVVDEIHLDEWLALKGPRQRQIVPLRPSLLASRVLLLTMRAERLTGDDPGPTEFSRRLAAIGIPMDRRRAYDRLAMIRSLETGDGPWCRKG